MAEIKAGKPRTRQEKRGYYTLFQTTIAVGAELDGKIDPVAFVQAYNSDKPPRIKDKAWGVFEAYKIGGIQLLAASTPIADYKLTRTEALEKALEYAKAKGVQPHYHPPK